MTDDSTREFSGAVNHSEPGQSAEEMFHLTIDCAKASSGHPSAENDEPEYNHCTCGRHASDQCDRCKALMNGKETAEIQIERRADFIIRELDEFCAMASNIETVDLIENEKIAVGQMQTRCQLILSFLAARSVPKFKVISNG